MKLLDVAKAFGAAFASLALNLALVTGAIVAYARLIAPGHPESFYNMAAPRIAMWTAPALGAALLAAFTAWLGRGRPGRNPYAFAAATWALYVILDVASGWAMDGLKSMLSPQMAISMLIALIGALTGGALAKGGSFRQGTAA